MTERGTMTSNDDLARQLRRLDECIDELTRAVVLLQERREDDRRILLRLNELIVGNGRAGINERVRNVERYLGAIRRLVWMAAGVIVVGALGFTWSIIRTSIERSAFEQQGATLERLVTRIEQHGALDAPKAPKKD